MFLIMFITLPYMTTLSLSADVFKDDLKRQITEISTSRALSLDKAFAFWICKHVHGLSDDDAEEAIRIGNPGDNAIDYFHIDDDNLIIFGQAKYSPNLDYVLSREELDDFLGSFDRLDVDPTHGNAVFQEKAAEFRDIKTRPYHIQMVIAVAGTLSPAALRELTVNRVLTINPELNDFQKLQIDDLANYIRDRPTPELTVLFRPDQLFSKTVDGQRSLSGTIRASEVIRLWKDYGQILFSLNPRDALRMTKTNKLILETLQSLEKRSRFWRYNNGISAVCDKITEVNDNPTTYRFVNFKIVNGRQTTKNLVDAGVKGWIDDSVEVMLRVHETADLSEKEDISTSTNTQNPITTTDTISTKKELREIALKIHRDYLGFYFEYQTEGFRGLSNTEKRNILKNGVLEKEATARYYLAFNKTKPWTSLKKGNSYIFDQLYEDIFQNRLPKDFIIPHIFAEGLNQLKTKWKRDNITDRYAKLIDLKIGKYYALAFIGNTLEDMGEKESIEDEVISLFKREEMDKIITVCEAAIKRLSMAIQMATSSTTVGAAPPVITYDDKTGLKNYLITSEIVAQQLLVLIQAHEATYTAGQNEIRSKLIDIRTSVP